MQRMIGRFHKGEAVRYTSHLDLFHTFERAVRRAEIPIAHSEGFNPHIKMAFGSALSLGVTSDCEWVDILLEQPMLAGDFLRGMSHALPDALELVECGVISPQHPALMAVLEVAEYRTQVIAAPEALQRGAELLLAETAVRIERVGKKGKREIDLRPFVLDIQVSGQQVELRLVTGSNGGAKPEEVVRAMAQLGGWEPACPPIHHRVEMYLRQGERLITPLEAWG